MATSNSLYVPIDLEAFCVGIYDVNGKDGSGYGTGGFAKVSNNFSRLPYLSASQSQVNGGNAPVSETILPGNFAENPVRILDTGIHLHWALPDALAHGENDENGSIAFREVPNRWLVVRTVKTDTSPDLTAWVVASDQLWDQSEGTGLNAISKAVPVSAIMDSSDKPFKAMGFVKEYSNFDESKIKQVIDKHTAVGYGETTYAAAYAHSQNVFGFYDELKDHAFDSSDGTKKWTVSYFVAGWYSDQKNDPITAIKFPANASYAAKAELLQTTYKWAIPAAEDTVAAPDFPSQTFCHGVLQNLEWEPGKVYVKKRATNKMDVSIGNTTAEALSALMAKESSIPDTDKGAAEQALNLLQLGFLADIDRPGGLGSAEEKLHQSGFGKTMAGKIWIVKRKDADKAQRAPSPNQHDISESLKNAAGRIDTPLPPKIASMLNALNNQQIGVNRLEAIIKSSQGQLFVDFYKYMAIEYSIKSISDSDSTTTLNDAFHFLEEETRRIQAKKKPNPDPSKVLLGAMKDGSMALLGAMKDGLSELKQQLQQEIGEKDWKIMEVESPQYWQPTDPVLLFSGEDVRPSDRHGRDGRHDDDDLLNCRVSGQLVSELTITQGDSVVGTVGHSNLPVLVGPATPLSCVDELEAMLVEALLLDAKESPALAAAAGLPMAEADAIAAAIGNLLDGKRETNKEVTFDGLPPSPVGMKIWSGANPWVPLMIQWEIDFYPKVPIKANTSGVESKYPTDFITSNFVSDDATMPIELVQKTPGEARTAYQTYRGGVLLTPNPEVSLVEEINKFISNYPNSPEVPTLKTMLAGITANPSPRQSQSLSGFNEALLMRKQALQLPVNNPLASGLTKRFINDELSPVIGDQNINAPLTLNYYNPLRAGEMKLSRVRIIDAFGQFQDLDLSKVTVAQTMKAASGASVGEVSLHPRITQPSRLMFRWISASDDAVESNSHPVTTPIFGWVMFNHLDDTLMIYDGGGSPVGSFNMRGPIWQGAPGHADSYGHNDPDSSLENLPEGAGSVHLKNFVNGVFGKISSDGTRDYLAALLESIDRSVTTIDPSSAKQHSDLSVLIGRPLALTRASVKLELDGLPALDQSWSSYNNAVNDGDYLPYEQRERGGFTDVKFPVQIGDLSKVNDGLIGYFVTKKDDSSLDAYSTFWAHAAAGTNGTGEGVQAPAFDHLQLTPSFGLKTETGQLPDGVNYPKAVGQTNEKSVFLTLLVDPRAPVHATTGILPTKGIEIPPVFYRDALAKMSVTFLTSPILTSAVQLTIPLPTEPGYAWSWVANTGTEWTEIDAIQKVNQNGSFSYPPLTVKEGWLKLSALDSAPVDDDA
jgi:hypothetical protein